MKLWDKGFSTDKKIETFTVGEDRKLDVLLAPFDVLGSIAHVKMLHKVGLLQAEELVQVHRELVTIYNDITNGHFEIADNIEDVHSQIEFLLTEKLGDVGKKIHSGRSRNDQVLVDLKLYARHKMQEAVESIGKLFDVLQHKSEEYKEVLLPGYTHLQTAMPSSFGLWFGAYAESLVDDLHMLKGAFDVTNQNPLGSAAGYGSSFPLDRGMTTNLLGFRTPNINVVYAQMGRGKTEFNILSALASVGVTLSRLGMDVCLYNSQNFDFLKLPNEFTTGSSIMPHKKNPDVFELIRATANTLTVLPNQITGVMSNLPSGYHRDYQLTKEVFMPAFDKLISCLEITTLAMSQLQVKDNILNDEKYRYLFTVEAVNEKVVLGMPFRDAYKTVGAEVEAGTFEYTGTLNHTHLGTIGNLGTDLIKEKFENVRKSFGFEEIEEKLASLKMA